MLGWSAEVEARVAPSTVWAQTDSGSTRATSTNAPVDTRPPRKWRRLTFSIASILHPFGCGRLRLCHEAIGRGGTGRRAGRPLSRPGRGRRREVADSLAGGAGEPPPPAPGA